MSINPDHEVSPDIDDEDDIPSPVDGAVLDDASANSPARATGGAIDEFDENDFDDDFDDDFEEEMDDDYEFEHELIEGEVVETDDAEVDELDEDDDEEEEEAEEEEK